jgi:hypothetical protein
VGASLRFVSSPGDGFGGEMVVFDPPSVMELMWGTDRLRIELTSDDGATVLTLTDSFTELGKAACDGAGWSASTVSPSTSTGPSRRVGGSAGVRSMPRTSSGSGRTPRRSTHLRGRRLPRRDRA